MHSEVESKQHIKAARVKRTSSIVSSLSEVVSSGGAPTPAGTSVFRIWEWDICGLMGGAFIT